jgi:hypothetical protein
LPKHRVIGLPSGRRRAAPDALARMALPGALRLLRLRDRGRSGARVVVQAARGRLASAGARRPRAAPPMIWRRPSR